MTIAMPQQPMADASPVLAARRLRVCHIITADLWAGAEVQVATAASYLAGRSDLLMTAVLFNDGWLANALRRLGIEVAILDEHRRSPLEILLPLTGFLRRHRVDLIHTHRNKDTVFGAAAAKLAGVPHLIRTVHGMAEPMRGWSRAKYLAYEALDRATLWCCADRIVAVSRRTAEIMKRSGYRPSTLTTIHNGINLRAVAPTRAAAAVRSAFGIDAGAFVVGTAGRLVPVKGHEFLVRAAARLVAAIPDTRMLFVGSGPREHELRDLARSLGVEAACLFVDPSSDRRADIYDLMAAVDVFALPSLSEGVPMALLEAMALGRPVVASAVGGVPEIVTDRATGLLVEPCRDAAIAAACLELARNRAWASALGADGRRAVEARFSHEQNGAALADLYHAVAERGAGAGAMRAAGAIGSAPSRSVAARIRRRVDWTIARRRAQRLRRSPAAVAAALAGAGNVLVVCHGNIIRSPFAARLLGQALGGLRQVSIASAGLDAQPGRQSHPLAIAAAAPLRVDLRDHAARRLDPESVAQADAIFAMDVEQLLTIRRRYPDAAHKTFLLTCLAPDTPLEVRDPVDGDAPVFRSCYEHIARAVPPLARLLAAETH